ncbi:MAG: L-alanine-DL-glutamate epimerase-like enolase superfamily enzyme [Saprospiraceae bacterium]|jgi:L-alanine-DL-glutamate epimerase-like enolase superfamily enzyme
MPTKIKLKVTPLHLPLKTNFKQASSSRNLGESIWVTASRGEIVGFGEGCPRSYVTGETVSSCMDWLNPQLTEIEEECTDLASLQERVKAKNAAIDEHPAAWCGIETALLDLFAKEQGISVEQLLGLKKPLAVYQYAAILSDGDQQKYEGLIERYLKWGFTDFKIKLNGRLAEDQMKLETLSRMCETAGVNNLRIRLDANNLWSGNTAIAIDHLSKLKIPFIGIEEPVEPKNPGALSKVSTSLDTAVILDESLCSESDLQAYDNLEGRFIANIKVSRVGGLIRSLKMIEALQARDWKIIIGAHVGESSVMTRAGMCAAQAAGAHLRSQEGCFGTILLSEEPVTPSLMFGARGQLDLTKPYILKTENGNIEFPLSTWDKGWGLVQS